LNPYIRQHWNEFGIYLLGFVHSHPSGWRPSTGDEIYARRILAAIPDMPYLLLPIVQTIPNTGSFQIHPYAAKRNGDNIAIIKLDLEIVENTGGFYTL
ncbi:MAG TPA: hypothetical protein VN207_06955, partial [Ktedonobacteraceae bacterium]|nr:hypothetical protein [Ktedonobacteraceae bacterium]